METIRLTTQVDENGTLKLEVPTHFANQQVEVIMVMQPVRENYLPPDFFEKLDAIQADDIVERPHQGIIEIRESFE